jgi:heptosyltransferase-1
MRIAIVKLSAMGDIIHAMVALQYIKKKYPDIIIDWFVESVFASVLANNPHINHIYPLNLKAIKKNKTAIFEQIKFLKTHSKNQYDLVIDAQGLIKSALVTKLLGKQRVGFDKESTREGFASLFYTQKVCVPYDKNAIERNCELLSHALDFSISKEEILNKEPFLFYEESTSFNSHLSKSKKNIVFIIGASWPSKMYDKNKFIQIINALDENALVVWGNKKEKSIATHICAHSCAKMMPKLSLNDLKTLISKADLIIGNDTGPTHMAWALNIPSITLFGNTPGYRNTYITKINKIIESSSSVNPFKLNREDFSIHEIAEQRIIEMAKQLLA